MRAIAIEPPMEASYAEVDLRDELRHALDPFLPPLAADRLVEKLALELIWPGDDRTSFQIIAELIGFEKTFMSDEHRLMAIGLCLDSWAHVQRVHELAV